MAALLLTGAVGMATGQVRTSKTVATQSLAQDQAAEALLRIADLYYEGTLVGLDLAKALDYYGRAAAAGSATGKVRVGEMLARGEGAPQDVARGLAMVREVAASGDANGLISLGDLLAGGTVGPVDAAAAIAAYGRAASLGEAAAYVRLGDLYSEGKAVATDGAAAAEAYEAAVKLGSTEAMLQLGDLYYDGDVVPLDLGEAFEQYRLAAEAGSGTGKLRSGQMLARGEGVARDVERGSALVRAVAETGDANGLIALGDLHARGDLGRVDPGAAIDAYLQAAALESTRALMRLGDLYCGGIIVAPDCQKALQYYRRAAELDDPYALYALGKGDLEGRFGPQEPSREAVELLQRAEAGGVVEATVALSDICLTDFRSRTPEETVAALARAAEAGDGAALRRLVEIYRDGCERDGAAVIGGDLALARSYLEQYGSVLTRNERALESLLLDVASRRRPDRSLYDRVEALSPRYRQQAVRAMRRINPNAYAFVIQTRLAELGLFEGPGSGVLTGPTIAAINALCKERGATQFCRFGPMSGQTASILAFAF